MSRERWWIVAKAVAYELRPFTLPTKDDLKNAAKATRTNAEQLWAEAQRLAPKVVEVARNSNPLRVFQLFLWLSGWALFIWLEFGECEGRSCGGWFFAERHVVIEQQRVTLNKPSSRGSSFSYSQHGSAAQSTAAPWVGQLVAYLDIRNIYEYGVRVHGYIYSCVAMCVCPERSECADVAFDAQITKSCSF